MLSTTLSMPIFCAASAVRPIPSAPATPSPSAARDPAARGLPLGPAPGRAREVAGAAPVGRRRRAGARPSGRTVRRRVTGLGDLDRLLVDLGHLVGDARPGVALGAAAARGLAHRRQPLGLVVGALQLLGEALRVGGRHQHAVDAVGDDVAVAGDRRGDHRGPGGEGLGQDHAEALAGERRRAEHVGVVELGARAPHRRRGRGRR